MKTLRYWLLILVPAVIAQSCHKYGIEPYSQQASSLTLVNAIAPSSSIVTNFNNSTVRWYSKAVQVSYGSFVEFALPSGGTPVSLFNIADTTNAIFHGKVNMQVGGIYSMFLSGSNPMQPDTLFNQDHPLAHTIKDSTISIRFVNLVPGIAPVSVDIKGKANGSEATGLSYHGITAFKNYPDYTGNSPNYTFEFRDAASGTLLSSLTLSGVANGTGTNTSQNSYRFKNFTIMLYGSGSSPVTALINNY